MEVNRIPRHDLWETVKSWGVASHNISSKVMAADLYSRSLVLKSWYGDLYSYSSMDAKNLWLRDTLFFVARFELNSSKSFHWNSKSEIHKVKDIYIY